MPIQGSEDLLDPQLPRVGLGQLPESWLHPIGILMLGDKAGCPAMGSFPHLRSFLSSLQPFCHKG